MSERNRQNTGVAGVGTEYCECLEGIIRKPAPGIGSTTIAPMRTFITRQTLKT